MKTLRKLSRMLMTCAILVGMMVLLAIPASAETKAIPKKVRIYPGYAQDAIEFTLPDNGYEVKDITTSSKNLYARDTHRYFRKSGSAIEENEATIGLYAKKTGKYTLKFAIYDADGNKVSSHKVTVYAKSDQPVKKFTYNGKTDYHNDPAASGKIKVTMNSGYTLKKIEVGKDQYKTEEDGTISSETVWKEVKNGKKITLSTNPYYYKWTSGTISDSYQYISMYKYMNAETQIRVTYIDKYTKLEDTTYFYISRFIG